MKIFTVVGTRPEIIRLSRIIPLLDEFCDHTLIHTGQNYDDSLSEVFFRELAIRKPDEYLQVQSSKPGEQIGQILTKFEELVRTDKPDRLLLLGDTNSALTAIIAKKYGIPVYHMEAGNRCFDDRVPEEANRRIVDHCSDVLLPYTQNSKANLLREGIEPRRIFVTGNPIKEILMENMPAIDASEILSELTLSPNDYFLSTFHRAENVDDPVRLGQIVQALSHLSVEHSKPVIISTHPRTQSKLGELERSLPGLTFIAPFSFFNFVKLEKNAHCVITDSGTVQEECNILGVPNVTIRDCTERPETIEAGSNSFVGTGETLLSDAVAFALRAGSDWEKIPEYEKTCVSTVVVKILLSATLRA